MPTWEEMRDAAQKALDQGDLATAVNAWAEAKTEAEKAGERTLNVASSNVGLAQTFNAMGRFAEAEKLINQATSIREEHLEKTTCKWLNA